MESDDLDWCIASRGFTNDIALGLLDNLFKIHSFGIGGLLTFIAASRPPEPYHCCAKALLLVVFIGLSFGLGTILWSWKMVYEGQDLFSEDGNSQEGLKKYKSAKLWAFSSFVCFILSAILFFIFLPLCV